MTERWLTVLGTAAQMPTRDRNQGGLFLKWDNYGFLIDPGEGTQRQMILAGISASKITDILITHFHGDHCLGLAGIVQRIATDGVSATIRIHYPNSGEKFLQNLINAAVYQNSIQIEYRPVREDGEIFQDNKLRILAGMLKHRIEAFGYRIEEQTQRTLIPGKLKSFGLRGPEISQLVSEGRIEKDGDIIQLEQVSRAKPTQAFVVIMDSAMCKNAYRLSERADLLVCESTYLHSELELADKYGHLTARQAASLASKTNVKRLILTHFSQRYSSRQLFENEAKQYFDADFAVQVQEFYRSEKGTVIKIRRNDLAVVFFM